MVRFRAHPQLALNDSLFAVPAHDATADTRCLAAWAFSALTAVASPGGRGRYTPRRSR